MARTKGFDLTGDAMKVVYGFLGIVLLLLFSAELLPEVNIHWLVPIIAD